MAVTSESTTVWTGTLFEGSGNVALDSSGLATFQVNWAARARPLSIKSARNASSPSTRALPAALPSGAAGA